MPGQQTDNRIDLAVKALLGDILVTWPPPCRQDAAIVEPGLAWITTDARIERANTTDVPHTAADLRRVCSLLGRMRDGLASLVPANAPGAAELDAALLAATTALVELQEALTGYADGGSALPGVVPTAWCELRTVASRCWWATGRTKLIDWLVAPQSGDGGR